MPSHPTRIQKPLKRSTKYKEIQGGHVVAGCDGDDGDDDDDEF